MSVEKEKKKKKIRIKMVSVTNSIRFYNWVFDQKLS